ncbi:aldo/keto reductase [Microbacterium oleivorans]|uniref:Aldo/keto reductase n=1 Tax=Microbacterium oleivorans TaxID=273677 RepID=A0A7D5EW56_9MICO|nr:aldo/keto reductase [Microbacterium oleivorans]QLD11204.1 aldo/keto reductase [Microbacterium oleivorans]
MTTDQTTTTTSAVDSAARRPLWAGGPEVTGLCIGTAGWSSVPGFRPAAPTLHETELAAERLFAGPVNFADTSNNYGGGESEQRLGHVIERNGGLPDGFVLQTKLDRDMTTGEFSGSRIRRSLEESLERLGLDRLPIAYLHDPENTTFDEATGPGGPVDEMKRMLDEGLIGALGISGGPVEMLLQYMDLGIFSTVITHNRYTLVDRSAAPVLDRARELGMGVLNGAPYGGGLLASYPPITNIYHYAPARPAILAAAESMGALLQARGIPLAAAALQFSLREPRVTSTIVGALYAEQIDAALELSRVPIDEDVWVELDALTPPASEWIPWPLPTRS